jgi:hypothetical protein
LELFPGGGLWDLGRVQAGHRTVVRETVKLVKGEEKALAKAMVAWGPAGIEEEEKGQSLFQRVFINSKGKWPGKTLGVIPGWARVID